MVLLIHGFSVMMMIKTQITLKTIRACQVPVRFLAQVMPVEMGLDSIRVFGEKGLPLSGQQPALRPASSLHSTCAVSLHQDFTLFVNVVKNSQNSCLRNTA